MKITFAHLGDYHRPLKYFLEKTTAAQIIIPPLTTKKTTLLGSKYSPEIICTPFKYNMGNFIEALEMGADTIIHIGGGCKFGYYAEVQEKILRDLGYEFTFYNLVPETEFSLKNTYRILKIINPNLKLWKAIHTGLYTVLCVLFKDKLDSIIRTNKVVIINQKSLQRIEENIDDSFYLGKSIFKLVFNYFKYRWQLKKLRKNKSQDYLRIGIIGELYDNIDVHANQELEKKLINMGVRVKRFINATSLLFLDHRLQKFRLSKIKKYDKYDMGADATPNIYRVKWLKNHRYDGIIHVKPFGCTPEIGVSHVLERISYDLDIPIMFLTFDNNNADIGITTRLEAFYDMLKMRKESSHD